jgi:putative Holliday junction resolvase
VRYLAVDPGARRLGLAVGDDDTGVASAVAVVPFHGSTHAADLIVQRAAALGAGRVVVGLPTSERGDETPACRRSHALAAAIAARGIPVDLQREFLTTNEARRRARALGFPPGRPVDHLAAQVLLEEYLALPGAERGRW